MQNLSDQEKKVLEIMKESKQQLTPEEITAEIKKRYGQVWPVQITITFMARLERLGYTDRHKR
jgi:predicted transcriptional regulator|nr:MAG TPA: putative Zinc uptake regulation protein [Caudoviricetes sp.]